MKHFRAINIVVLHFATEKFWLEYIHGFWSFRVNEPFLYDFFLLLNRNVSSVLSSFNLRKTPRNKWLPPWNEVLWTYMGIRYFVFCLLVLFVLSKSLWQSRVGKICQKLKIRSVIRLRFWIWSLGFPNQIQNLIGITFPIFNFWQIWSTLMTIWQAWALLLFIITLTLQKEQLNFDFCRKGEGGTRGSLTSVFILILPIGLPFWHSCECDNTKYIRSLWIMDGQNQRCEYRYALAKLKYIQNSHDRCNSWFLPLQLSIY